MKRSAACDSGIGAGRRHICSVIKVGVSDSKLVLVVQVP